MERLKIVLNIHPNLDFFTTVVQTVNFTTPTGNSLTKHIKACDLHRCV